MTSRANKKRAYRERAVVGLPRATAPQRPVRAREGWMRRATSILGAASTLGDRRQRHLDLALSAGVVLLVAAPMLFTKSGFAVDFTNHLWLTWVAGKALAQAGHPS